MIYRRGRQKSPSPEAHTHNPTTPKQCIKQGPINSSKKVKAVEHKDGDKVGTHNLLE